VKEAGFTLVEVLAALVIFSVAIIGLSTAGTQSVAHTQNPVARRLAAKAITGRLKH